ncbi:hypothetical protein A2U01_0101427, partial [Trifolium medium]|nr:hypothetical protein [Trifolium medium]
VLKLKTGSELKTSSEAEDGI